MYSVTLFWGRGQVMVGSRDRNLKRKKKDVRLTWIEFYTRRSCVYSSCLALQLGGLQAVLWSQRASRIHITCIYNSRGLHAFTSNVKKNTHDSPPSPSVCLCVSLSLSLALSLTHSLTLTQTHTCRHNAESDSSNNTRHERAGLAQLFNLGIIFNMSCFLSLRERV